MIQAGKLLSIEAARWDGEKILNAYLGYVRYEALSRFLPSRVNDLKVRAKVWESPAEYSVDIGTHKLQQ